MTRGRIAFAAALAAILGLYVAACLYAAPIADDFIYASNARSGLAHAWVQEYVGWNGRYASNALLLGTPLSLGLWAYRFAAAVMIVTSGMVAYALLRAFGDARLSRSDAAIASAAFCSLLLSQTPSIGDSVYWYTSAATYQAWVVPGLLHLALIFRYARPADRPGWALPLAAVLLAIAAGFNEVVTGMLVAFYAAWLLWSLAHEPSDRTTPAVLLTTAVLSSSCMLLSPGNAVRQAMYAGVRHQVYHSALWTVLQTARFAADWLSSGALLIATLLFIPVADTLTKRWPQDPSRAGQLLTLLVAGMALVVPAAVFPAYWETGTLGQHRTISSAYFVFLVLWFAAVPAMLVAWPRRGDALRACSERWRTTLGILLIAALALTRNSYALGSDFLSGRLAGFERAMSNRFERLQACHDGGESPCEVDQLRDPPASFITTDVAADSGNWVNAAYARYFGIPEVRGRRAASSEHVRD